MQIIHSCHREVVMKNINEDGGNGHRPACFLVLIWWCAICATDCSEVARIFLFSINL